MTNQNIASYFKNWLEGRSNWEQILGFHFCNGGDISKEILEKAYICFKSEFGLTKSVDNSSQPVVPNTVTLLDNDPQNSIVSSNLIIKKLFDIEGVNAISKHQSIDFGQKITVLYGENGAGKSGYTRLLNNVFNSRGNKKITPNIFLKDSIAEPSCTLEFTDGRNNSYIKSFPKDTGCAEFTKYAVFDSMAANVHLNEENQLCYTPHGFVIFEQQKKAYDLAKEMLLAEIQTKRKPNIFLDAFQNQNEIREFILKLSADTTFEDVESKTSFTTKDQNDFNDTIVRLNELKTSDYAKKLQELDNIGTQITEYIKNLQDVLSSLSSENINSIYGLISDYKNYNELALKQGIESLTDYQIKNIGSIEWTNFIQAARKYIESFSTNTSLENCPLCLQKLNDNEQKLFSTYSDFLKSEATKQAKITETKLNEKLRELKNKSNNQIKLDEKYNLYSFLKNHSIELADNSKSLAEQCLDALDKLCSQIKEKNFEIKIFSISADLSKLNSLKVFIDKEKENLFLQNKDQEIKNLTLSKIHLEDKLMLSKKKTELESYIADLKWIKQAEGLLSEFKTNALTIFHGEMTEQFITENYLDRFKEECKGLDAPDFVELSYKNQKAQSYRALVIKKHKASDILSEGEQRAIALADFITESALNPDFSGIIFDDPVTSLDHLRRDKIAERLVKLSMEKHVIIFTHDIAFLFRLEEYCDNYEIELSKINIRKIGDEVGVVNTKMPWIASKVNSRIGYLRDRLQTINKLEYNSEDYIMNIKHWYGILRETWERCIEERLLQGAINRFSPEIQTKKIEKITITQEFVDMINEGMTESSNWIHDSSFNLNPRIPQKDELKKSFESIEEFVAKCKIQ